MKGNQKTKTNTRGMLNVKGLDLEDDEDDFANRQYNSFPLWPSVKEFGKGQKKKKKCCGSSTQ